MVDAVAATRDEESEQAIELNLREIWQVLRRRQTQVIGGAVLSALLCAIVIFAWPDHYRAESTIMVESRDAKVVSIQEVYDIGAAQSEYFYTQYEVLKSRELAAKVITLLDLVHHPVFRSGTRPWLAWLPAFLQPAPPSDDAVFQEVLEKFADNLEVTPVRNTQLVRIAFNATDPAIAADILNTLGKVYIENDLDARLDMTRQAASWINSRMEGLRTQLEQSEKSLQNYREKEKLLEVEGVRTLASQELNELTSKLMDARRKRTEAENIVAQIDQDTSSNPAVLQHPLVQKLKEQEALAEQRLFELSRRYGPQHPKIIAANSELEAARSSYDQQVAKVVEGVRREYQIAKATEESLSAALEKLKGDMQDINRKEYRLNELERAVTVNRQLYDTFFSRMKETSETESLPTAHARIIDRAIAPAEPSQLPRSLLVLVATLLSALGSVALALLQERFDNTLSNPDDVRRRLGETLLGVLPLMKEPAAAATAATLFCRETTGSFAESVRTIRTAILVASRTGEARPAAGSNILLVTSAVPGEGKSAVAANIAAAFGQMGRTLLIDADLRRPSAARNFALSLAAPGLAELLAGRADEAQCIQQLAAWRLDVLPAGQVPANPLELLSSARFTGLLAALQQRYDHIVIDTAPCEAVSDALALSAFASAVIYVVRAGATDCRAISAGLTRLKQAGAPLKGVVLNQVDIEKGRRAGYYYGGYYGQGSYGQGTCAAIPG